MIRQPTVRFGSAEDGKKTGDRTGVGLFIPLPEDQCEGFPSRAPEDNSPCHVTFLYVGDVAKERESEFLQILEDTFMEFKAPVRGVTGPVDYFPQPDKDRRVAYLPLRFDRDLASLRWKVRDALISNDFQVDDSFPLVYKPHTTLSYMDGVGSVYVDDVPVVDWTFDGMEVWGLPRLHIIPFNKAGRTARRHLDASKHQQSVSLMKFLSGVAQRSGVGKHVYVVGGAVRNFLIDQPIKDIDVVIDSVALNGRGSDWFAKKVQKAIPVQTSLVTNQYGVAILTVKGEWVLDGESLKGEVIEIANARKESYGGEAGKGYKPHTVAPATIEEDINRREFTFNTLLWRLHDLANGPDKAEILDLTGCGRSDLQDGWMRCPSSPDKTFSDDPSRMIRAIKFLIKYGFKIDSQVKASILKNAQKLKNVPSSHLSNMLIETFYEAGTGKKALLEMKKLGLLDVLKEIARTDRNFQKALANWADKKADVQFLFDLMDLGMPSGKRLSFLNGPQLKRVRELTVQMSASEAASFVALLSQPGKSLDMGALIKEFGLKGKEIQEITTRARKVLLDDPTLLVRPARWQSRVKQQMSKAATGTEAETFSLNEGDPVLYGKYKNKRGLIKEFKKDEKSGDPIVVIEPNPKGRKQDKELKLFKIRYDKGRAEADKEAMAMPKSFMYYFRQFVDAAQGFSDDLSYGRSQPGWDEDNPRTHAWFLEGAWHGLIRSGRELARSILDQKSVPAKDRKAFEKASRLFMSARRKPRDILKWYEKNGALIRLLRFKSDEWPDKTEGDEKFKLGPFTVHNTIGLEGSDLDKVKAIIKKATAAIKRLQIPAGIKKVLYGDIYIVARIQKSKTVAWYYRAEDDIYIRRSDGSWDDAVALVHELGHRYLDKFARGPDKSNWMMYHNWLSGKDVALEDDSVKLPSVGDKLPVLYRGTKRGYRPIIKEIKGGLYYFDVEDKNGVLHPMTYPVADLRQFEMQKSKKIQKLRQFPTPYSSTNWEEHFCEALGLYAMKKLKGDHVDHFEERWGKRAAINRVARRYMKKAVEYMAVNIKRDDGSEVGEWKIPVDSFPLLTGGSPVEESSSERVAARWLKSAAGKYKDKKTVKKQDGGEMTVYEYTEGQVQHRNREKARRLDRLDDQFPKLKTQVGKDLKAEDGKTRQTALAVALINETYERVGNDESASKGHYGVTGWLKKHITFSGNSVTFKYVGKSGVKHDKKVTDKKLVSALKKALKGKGADDEVFEDVSASDINTYLKPYDITAKDIRGFHANREMREALKKERAKGPKLLHARKEKDKILKAEFKKALEAVADTVGHEPATLRSQYLVPGLEDQFTHNGTTPKGQKKASTTYKGTLVPSNWDGTPEGYYQERLQQSLSLYDNPYRYCPVCGQWYSMQTRGMPSRFSCPNGHEWVWCDEHSVHVLMGEDANPPRKGCRCEHGTPVPEPHPRDVIGAFEKAKEGRYHPDGFLTALEEKLRPAIRLQRLRGRRDPDGIEKWATKTPAEKEDEEAERMVRPAPKLKPPRQDLRRNRVQPDDPDVKTEGADKDKDLSKNYKRVAARWLRKLAAEHKPGDVWETDKGWVGMNPAGNTHTFKDQGKAQEFAKGQGEEPDKPDKPQDTKEKPQKPQKPDESSGSGVKPPESKPPVTQLHGFLEGADDSLASKYDKYNDTAQEAADDSLASKYDKYNDTAQEAAAKAYHSKWKSLKGRSLSGISEELVDEVSSASNRAKRPGQSAESFGESAAELAFAHQVLANPTEVLPLSGGKEDSDALNERGKKAFEHFSKLDSDLRREAFHRTSEQLTNMPEDSAEREQMTRMLEGLWLASVAADDDPDVRMIDGNPLVSEPSQMTKSMIKTVKDNKEDVSDMLSVDFYGPAGREKARGYMDEMSDDDLTTLFAGGDSELESMIQKAMSELTEPWQREMLRGLMRDLSLNTMTSMHAVATAEFEGRRKGGVPEGSDLPIPKDVAESAEMAEEAHRRVKKSPKFKSALQKFHECLAEAEDKESCKGLDHQAQLIQVAEMLRVMEEDFGITDENHPKIVQLRTALEEGNPGVLDEKFVAAGANRFFFPGGTPKLFSVCSLYRDHKERRT